MFSWITIWKQLMLCLNEIDFNSCSWKFHYSLTLQNINDEKNVYGENGTMILHENFITLPLYETFTSLNVEYIATLLTQGMQFM